MLILFDISKLGMFLFTPLKIITIVMNIDKYLYYLVLLLGNVHDFFNLARDL